MMNGLPQEHRRLLPTLRLLAFLLVFAAAIFSSVRTFEVADQTRELAQKNSAVLRRINMESTERRNQICLSDEREHKENVDRLVRTYGYIESLTPRQRGNAINQAVILQLPVTEKTAQTDTAPDFCDEPGVKNEKLYQRTQGEQGKPPVGLPEPDPVVPKRSTMVDKAFKSAVEKARH